MAFPASHPDPSPRHRGPLALRLTSKNASSFCFIISLALEKIKILSSKSAGYLIVSFALLVYIFLAPASIGDQLGFLRLFLPESWHKILDSPENLPITGYNLRIYFDVIVCLFLFRFRNRLDRSEYLIFMLSFLGVAMRLAFQGEQNLGRLSYYFLVFYPLALASFVNKFHYRFNNLFYVVFLMVYSFLVYLRQVSSIQFNPYDNVIFHYL